MSNDKEELRRALHNLANSQPKSDPFSYSGALEWREWSESCRCAEEALTNAGEEP